jgi:acetyl-CoA carboxylase beta subunit
MPRLVKDKIMPITKNDLDNARQDTLRKKENEEYKKHLEREKEENEAPRKAIGEAFDYVKGKASKLGEDAVKFAKDSLGMKKGGKISLKNCKVNTAETRNSKHKNCW